MKEDDIRALTEATAGAVGGLLSTSLLYPLDTCKTKFQAEARAEGEQRKYRSILDVLREAIAERRILSLYQGLPTKNFQAVLATFVYFYSYSYVKNWYLLRSGAKHLGAGANLLVAAAAGCCSALVTQPLDTLSARMQTSHGTAEGLLVMLRERGLAQTFDGLGASLLLTVNPAIQYTVFEQLKDRLLRAAHRRNEKARSLAGPSPVLVPLVVPVALSAFTAFLLGAFSKTVATVLTYPLIRCKVLMQRADTLEEKERRLLGEQRVGAPKNMLQAFSIIWHAEGLPGLYKGMSAQILKTVLAAAVMLMIKEKVSESTRLVIGALRRSLADRKRVLMLEAQNLKNPKAFSTVVAEDMGGPTLNAPALVLPASAVSMIK